MAMSKIRGVLIFLLVAGSVLVLAPLARSDGGEKTENYCVQCHLKLLTSNFVGVRSHAWKGSIHQKYGVTCDKCHGGDPHAADQKKAHVGVLGSSDPKSSVYFKNTPYTCGKCHGAELYEFSQSNHYEMLESEGKGPTCVTCHGSMVVTVLSPDDVVAVCDRCHNERMGIFPYVPQKARAVLLLLRTGIALADADSKLYRPPEGSHDAVFLRDAQLALHTAKLDWHRFDLDTLTDHLQDEYDSLEKLTGKSCTK